MRSTLIFLPLLAVVSSVLAAPTPKCNGWKPGKPEKPDWKPKWPLDVKLPIDDPQRINTRAVPDITHEVELMQRIDC